MPSMFSVMPSACVRLSAAIEERAHVFHKGGLRPLDALHLACAVEAAADYFCTCDDRLLKRAKAIHTGPPKVVNPLETHSGDRAMTVHNKPLAEVTHQAIEILCRELGAADTMPFINEFTNGPWRLHVGARRALLPGRHWIK